MFDKLLRLFRPSQGNGFNGPEPTPREERNDAVAKPFTVRYLVDKTDQYKIEFRPQADGTIKLFALEHPPDPWSQSAKENHLYQSGEICVTKGREPRTAERAKAIAMVWSKGWSVYMRTGTFPNGPQRVNVPEA